MNDAWGRRPTYLRVSLTQECQLACLYCRAAPQGATVRDCLTTGELLRLARGLVDICGIEKIRLTGGEPLLHPEVVEVAACLRKLPGVRYLGLTTNALRLPELAGELRRVGVDGVNVSLDSLRPEVYRRLTGGGALEQAVAGLEAARRYDWRLKINTVLVAGYNDDEILDFVRWVEGTPIELRFIEVMPTGLGDPSLRERLVPSTRVRAVVGRAYRLAPLPRAPGASARLFRAQRNGAVCTVGLISPVTDPFCAECNRLRLTADGTLVACLLTDARVDLRPCVRPRWRPRALELAVRGAVTSKPLGQEPGASADMLRVGG